MWSLLSGIVGVLVGVCFNFLLDRKKSYIQSMVSPKISDFCEFKKIYGNFMSNCNKVVNERKKENNISNVNKLLKKIEEQMFRLQLTIDSDFPEYNNLIKLLEKYAKKISSSSDVDNYGNKLKCKIFVYIFFEKSLIGYQSKRLIRTRISSRKINKYLEKAKKECKKALICNQC